MAWLVPAVASPSTRYTDVSFKPFWKGLEVPPDLLPRRLALLDVGARGGTQWPWDQIPESCLDITLVEPDPKEAGRLRRSWEATGRGNVLATALWSEDTTLPLHVNRSPGTSSVFPPNFSLLNQFPDADRFETISSISVPARAIDSIVAAGELGDTDVAKVDVQGAELAVLSGGAKHFSRNLVALELEVSFCELYSGQPLFADVDAFVRGLGLELWDLRKTHWKFARGRHRPGPLKGRLVFGDALYLRPLQGLESWLSLRPLADARSKVVMLAVTALAYGYVDYAATILDEPSIAKFVSPEARTRIERAIDSVGRGFRLTRNGNRALFWFFHLLAVSTEQSTGGWATTSQGLGSRRRGPFWS